MKYKTIVRINKDIDTVIAAIQSKEAALIWIDGLTRFELIEGEEGKANSKYKMTFDNGKKTSEMVETITSMNPPRNITTVYELGSVWNECINTFNVEGDYTMYSMETTFKFGFFFKLFAWAFKPIFKKETLKGMLSFKKYVESL